MEKGNHIALGAEADDFIRTSIEKGRYASASEVVDAGLRLLEVEERKLDALREALIQGESSGIAEDYDIDALQHQLDREFENE